MNRALTVQDRLDMLQEENRQLREIIARLQGGDDVSNAIRVFRLSRRQATIFAMLLRRDTDRVDLANASYDFGRMAELESTDWAINSLIRHIRAKTRPFGIRIESIYGFGYRMIEEHRRRAREIMEAAR